MDDLPDALSALEPGIRQLLEERAALPSVEITAATAPLARAMPGLIETHFGSGPALRSVEDRLVRDGGLSVPVRIYRPDNPRGVALFLHGGGWLRGSVSSYDAFTRTMAQASGFTVMSVDYRLAPENPFPAALDDSLVALEAAAALANDGPDRGPLVLVGESAGGNLAAVLAIIAAERRIAVARQVLVYPVTDHDFDTGSYRAFADGFLLTRAAMMTFWDLYAGSNDRRDLRLSPLRAASLANVAPAYIVTGGLDPLRDEGEAYCARLRAENVATVLRRHEGLPHGFIALHRISEKARHANEDIYRAVSDAAGLIAAP